MFNPIYINMRQRLVIGRTGENFFVKYKESYFYGK